MVDTAVTEAEWLAILRDVPEWKPPPSRPTLIVAPHPDDETLAAGGLIAAQRSRGLDVHVAAVTDGEKAYPDAPGLAVQREGEQANALARLSVSRERITRFRFPDGSVSSFEGELEDRLSAMISRETLVVAPWKRDHHSDHESCGRVAERIAKRAGATLCSYFFWTWHWGKVEEMRGVPLRRFILGDRFLQAKSEALLCHRSQLEREDGNPVLPEILLKPARRSFEVFAIE